MSLIPFGLNDPFFSPFGTMGGMSGFGPGFGGGLLSSGMGGTPFGTTLTRPSTVLAPFDDRQLLDFSRMASDPLPIDVEEKDNEFMVRVHQREAGLRKRDLRVDIDNGALTIRGEREKEQGDQMRGNYRREYRSVYRSMALPDTVDADKVEARYEGNMLVVHLPKKPGTEGRRSIQIGGQQQGQIGQGQQASTSTTGMQR